MKDKSLTLPEQETMLERLCWKHDLEKEGCYRFEASPNALAALRELLLAVQEADAAKAEEWTKSPCHTHEDDPCCHARTGAAIAQALRRQTYSDLFPEERNDLR